MNIPKTHTLTLSTITITAGVDGGRVPVVATVQTIQGSLQPMSGREILETQKITADKAWKFYVNVSEFTSSANEAKLKESNRLTLASPAHTFNILDVQYWSQGDYYKVIVEEKT